MTRVFYPSLLLVVFLLLGCEKEVGLEKVNNREYSSINDLLESLESKTTPAEYGIFTEIVYDKSTGSVEIIKTAEKELGIEYLFFYMEADEDRKNLPVESRANYTVSCSGGSEGEWEEDCNGKISCGRLVARCLDEGGCATVCNALIITIPELQTHIVQTKSI